MPKRLRELKHIRTVAVLVVLSATIATAIVGDVLLGKYKETSRIREESRQFRAEAAPFRMPTLNLVPTLQHSFLREAPDTTQGGVSGAKRLFRTDANGTILPGPERLPGKTKILFLGGSTTECNEVDEQLRFPAVVENLLRKAGYDATAINAGVRGHTTQDSINALLNRPGFRDADIIVLMHNINDRLALALRGSYSGDLGIDAPTTGTVVVSSCRAFIVALWDYLSYRSNALFLLRTAGRRFDPWTGEKTGIDVSEGNIDFGKDLSSDRRFLFEQNLRTFIAIAKSLGKRPILVTQPLGVESKAQTIFNDSIRTTAQQQGSLLIDLDAKLTGDRSWAFLPDNIHLSNHGSKAVGQLIAAALGPLLGTALEATPPDSGIVYPDELLAGCSEPSDHPTPTPTPPKMVLGASGRYPNFSPDGRWMLFQTWVAGRDRLRAFNIPNRNLVELTPPGSSTGERHPSFLSATGNEFEIVFGSGFDETRPDSSEQLMVRHWPSMQTQPLIPDADQGGAIPAVRGTQVVFAGSRRNGPDRVPDLYRFDRGTSKLEKLFQSRSEEWRPAISPDGTVFFISDTKGDFDIWSLKPGASQPELFQRSPADEWDPAVSPDGEWLAYASKRGGNFDIYLTPSDDPTKVFPITSLPADEWDPAWHSSGKMLVFASKQGEDSRIYGTCIFGRSP